MKKHDYSRDRRQTVKGSLCIWSNNEKLQVYTAVKGQTAVNAYLKSKQLHDNRIGRYTNSKDKQQ